MLYRALVIVIVVALPARAAEILFDDSGWRVVSGDWAARVTRGIGMEPQPTSVTLEQVSAVLAAETSEPFPFPATAVQSGVERFGWAQAEFEPEQTSDHWIYKVFVPGDSPSYLNLEVHDIERGYVGQTRLSLDTGDLLATDMERPEPEDRSVYASFSSAENFILMQEHFRKQFFESMLDIKRPDFAAVRKAYEANKYTLALYEVAEYFRRKTTPLELIRKPTANPATTVDETGDRICQHVFAGYGSTIEMGPTIDWNRQPKETGVAEWLWDFNSHHHFTALLEAYLNTANEKYAREFVDQMTDFIIQNPAPPYTLTRVGSWRNLEAGNRMIASWPQSFYGFLSSPSFTPQAIALMLGSIWSHGDYLHKHPAGLRRPTNWSVVDSSGLVGVSVYWPELAQAGTWRESGFARLERQLNLQVYPDGAQYELAPSYHLYCLDRFKRALELGRQTGHALPDAYAKGVERMYEFVMWLVKPDGTVPAFSDSHRNDVRAVLREGGAMFDRNDVRYVASGGVDGTPPSGASHLLPYAGYAVMRSDWSPDALYLCFDGGPVGTNHQHEDKLSFVLSAYGKNFIVDRGPYIYTRDEWRKWCISTAAHSTVLIDGKGQQRMKTGQELTAAEHPETRWQSTDDFDYAFALYDTGYGPTLTPVTHRRHIFFRKPLYWVIVDEIEGDGKHRVETLFHFASDQQVHADGKGRVTTVNPDGPNLAIQPALTELVRCDVVKGQEEPVIQGWDAAHGNERTAAPTVVYQEEALSPSHQAYLLYPTRVGEESGTLASFRVTGETIEVTVTMPDSTIDRISINTATHRAGLSE